MTQDIYYSILGLAPGEANPDTIREAYRRAVVSNHPDKAAGDPYAAERLKLIQEAYDRLIDLHMDAREQTNESPEETDELSEEDQKFFKQCVEETGTCPSCGTPLTEANAVLKRFESGHSEVLCKRCCVEELRARGAADPDLEEEVAAEERASAQRDGVCEKCGGELYEHFIVTVCLNCRERRFKSGLRLLFGIIGALICYGLAKWLISGL